MRKLGNTLVIAIATASLGFGLALSGCRTVGTAGSSTGKAVGSTARAAGDAAGTAAEGAGDIIKDTAGAAEDDLD